MDRDDERETCALQRILREERRTLLVLVAVVLTVALFRKIV